METETYEIRDDEPSWINIRDYNAWHKKREYYSSVFHNTANVFVRCINTKNGNKNENLENLISTSYDGENRTGTSLISALYYYEHGKVGSLRAQFAFKDAPVVWMISLNDMKNIFKRSILPTTHT